MEINQHITTNGFTLPFHTAHDPIPPFPTSLHHQPWQTTVNNYQGHSTDSLIAPLALASPFWR